MQNPSLFQLENFTLPSTLAHNPLQTPDLRGKEEVVLKLPISPQSIYNLHTEPWTQQRMLSNQLQAAILNLPKVKPLSQSHIYYKITANGPLTGHKVPIHDQDQPGIQKDMKGPDPVNKQVPSEDGGYATYLAAGKLKGKKAIITGGDSGIGRAIAILFAMEGADSFIVYLPDEQKDAEETKRLVEKEGAKCWLYATDLRKMENCKKVVGEAAEKMGGINILANNAAYQNMINDIEELTEYVQLPGRLNQDFA